MMASVSRWLGDWGNLLATTVVAIATVSYVVLTSKLSTSSSTAAASAQQAAAGSLQAARATERAALVAVAQLPISFDLEPTYADLGDAIDELAVQVICSDSTVYVHGLVLDFVGVETPEFGAAIRVGGFGDISMVARPRLPTRLHKGEEMTFDFPPETAIDDVPVLMSGVVLYSLDGVKEMRSRGVRWRASVSEFEVTKASYADLDVTDNLRARTLGGRLQLISVDPQFLGVEDPTPGIQKTLEIQFLRNGKADSRRFRDGDVVSLPPP